MQGDDPRGKRQVIRAADGCRIIEPAEGGGYTCIIRKEGKHEAELINLWISSFK